MTYTGAVIDGPLFGKNLAAQYPIWRVAVFPKMMRAMWDSDLMKPVDIIEFEYRWYAGIWSCAPLGALPETMNE